MFLSIAMLDHQKYSIRFATKTAYTQGTEERGKKPAYFAQSKADWGQTWSSLALSLAEHAPTYAAEVGRVGFNLRPTEVQRVALSPQNEPGLGPTRGRWPKGAQLVGPCWSEVGPKAIQKESKVKP